MSNDNGNAREVIHEIAVVSVALFFPLAVFLAIVGA